LYLARVAIYSSPLFFTQLSFAFIISFSYQEQAIFSLNFFKRPQATSITHVSKSTLLFGYFTISS